MGVLPCPLPCHKHKESISQPDYPSTHHRLQSEPSSSSSSLSSQPSLPSVPSLNSSSSFQNQQHELQSPAAASSTTQCHHQCLATLNVKGKGKGRHYDASSSSSSYISSLAISGMFLFSGSSNSEIRAWNRGPYSDNSVIGDHDNVVATGGGNGVAVVKSLVVFGNKALISAHQDNKIRVWKINNDTVPPASSSSSPSIKKRKKKLYECVATLPTLSDRFLRCFSADNYVQVRRHKKCTWVHHVDAVSSLALSTDGSLLYSASWDRSFKVWRTSDSRCLESVRNAHDDAINAIVVSGDGIVYTGSADKTIKVWKNNKKKKSISHSNAAATAEVVKTKHSLVDTLEKHRSAVNALALSSDGTVLYSGACDRSILVWGRIDHDHDHDHEHEDDDDDGKRCGHVMALKGALRGHRKAILCLAVVASDLICSGSADNTIRVWRRSSSSGTGTEKTITSSSSRYSYSCLAVLEGHRKPVKCLTGHRDDGPTSFLIYSGSLDGDIKIWKISVPFL